MTFCDIMSAFVQNPKFEQRARGRRLGVELDGRVHAQRIWCDDDIEPGLFNSKIKTRRVGGLVGGGHLSGNQNPIFPSNFRGEDKINLEENVENHVPRKFALLRWRDFEKL